MPLVTDRKMALASAALLAFVASPVASLPCAAGSIALGFGRGGNVLNLMQPAGMMSSFPIWMIGKIPPSRESVLARLWDIQEPPEPERLILKGHADTVSCLAFSPDGSTLASGSTDKSVILWDVATKCMKDVLRGHSSRISSLAFSPDGRSLATASDDQTIILWDLVNHKILGHDRLQTTAIYLNFTNVHIQDEFERKW
jgi:hypothetical protein